MGWRGNDYFYSKRLLRTIAENYSSIYEGLPTLHGEITNLWALAEFKADFDRALNSIGRGRWIRSTSQWTDIKEFKYYRQFGRLQKTIIADIIGIEDYELERLGFYDIPRLRGFAYYLMVKFLNGS